VQAGERIDERKLAQLCLHPLALASEEEHAEDDVGVDARLEQVVLGATGDRTQRELLVIDVGEDDDGYALMLVADADERVEAAAVREGEVEQHRIDASHGQQVQPFAETPGVADLEPDVLPDVAARRRQRVLDEGVLGRVLVDDEDTDQRGQIQVCGAGQRHLVRVGRIDKGLTSGLCRNAERTITDPVWMRSDDDRAGRPGERMSLGTAMPAADRRHSPAISFRRSRDRARAVHGGT
jgi:hypothetical protein